MVPNRVRHRAELASSAAMSDPIEDRVREVLATTGVPHELLPCDPALADTAEYCAAYGWTLDRSANTIVVVGKSDPPRLVACVVLATHRLDVNGVVGKRVGAAAADPRRAPGMQIGGGPPSALPDELEIGTDAEVTRRDQLILGGGSRSLKVLAPPEALLALPNAVVVDGLANPIAPMPPQA